MKRHFFLFSDFFYVSLSWLTLKLNSIMSYQNTNSSQEKGDLQRSLSNRHLQLIAIGGAIGTGLFMGSGKTISLAGPSILIIYMIIGFMVIQHSQ